MRHAAEPGGDDDGSGTSLLLSLTRLLARDSIVFSTSVNIVFFAGEEQGLIGSKALAKEMRESSVHLRLMVQIDMVAYRKEGEPLQLGFPDKIGSPEAARLLAVVAGTYAPELVVGFTPACCSDHQSFDEAGFPSTWLFERNGPIADPKYHNSLDLSDRPGYSFEQLLATTKVVTATLLSVAGFEGL